MDNTPKITITGFNIFIFITKDRCSILFRYNDNHKYATCTRPEKSSQEQYHKYVLLLTFSLIKHNRYPVSIIINDDSIFKQTFDFLIQPIDSVVATGKHGIPRLSKSATLHGNDMFCCLTKHYFNADMLKNDITIDSNLKRFVIGNMDLVKKHLLEQIDSNWEQLKSKKYKKINLADWEPMESDNLNGDKMWYPANSWDLD